MRDLWHAAGRAAGDRAKRRVALLGVLWSAPALVVGALLSRLLSDPGNAFAGLTRPLAYVFGPLQDAYAGDHDVALFGYVALQGLLLALVWGLFGGALHRLAAVDLSLGRREETAAALRFARKHWRGVVGAKASFVLGAGAPLAAAVGLATLGRIEGMLGGVLVAVATFAVVALVFLAVFIGFCWLVAGFLTTPVIACEDSNAFDGLSRTFGYAAAGLPRLTLWRLAFHGGVWLGALWRGVRVVAVIMVTFTVLRLGAGNAALDRVHAILASLGAPPDGERLGVGTGDYVFAFAVALVLFLLAAWWLADVLARCACARTAVYLAMRERIDGIARDELASAPEAPAFQDADAAGFEEVARVGEPQA